MNPRLPLAGLAAAASLLALAACGSTPAAHADAPAPRQAAAGAGSHFTATQQKFATAVQTWLVSHHDLAAANDSQIISSGEQACTQLKGSRNAMPTGGADGQVVVKMAVRYLCPGEYLAPGAAAVTPAEARFVTGLRAALHRQGKTDGETDAQIARAGKAVCRALRSGSTVSSIATASGGAAVRLVARMSEKYLCRDQISRVLLRLSGSGIENSQPFPVSSSAVKVRYSYDCAAQGTGNFIADLETADQGSAGSDDQSIANALSSGGRATTTVYPEDQGALYHLSVDSECSWSVIVSTG